MTNSHPSEMEIQQYAVDKTTSTQMLTQHIETCMLCQRQISDYQSVITVIKEQHKPAFDFDLSALVLARLKPARRRLRADRFVAGFLICFILSCIGLPLYLFRTYILNMFSGISPFFIYSILICATAIIIVKGIELYRKYQSQIRFLNFN